MSLQSYIEQRLEQSAVTPDQLQELLVRLLNYGVLVRDDSQTVRELYDRFVRIEELVTEILALQAIQVHHDRRFEYLRLYPPGSRTPGMDYAEEHAFGGSLRARLTQNEVAVVLVLRAQYDKAVREGKIDGRGYAAEPLEAIGLALKKWLNRSLPERLSDRREVFRRLKKLRLIDYHEDDDLEQTEAWIRIHPMIVDFVGADAIEALQPSAATDGAARVS